MKIATLSLILAGFAAVGSMTTAIAQTTGESKAMAAQTGKSVAGGDADGAFVSLMKFSEPTGETLYRRVCAGCHMPDAKGAKGAGFYPALAGNEKLSAAGYPTYIVLHGLNGMPPVGKLMTDAQVADVVNYVRTHFGNKYRDKVTAEDAKAAR